MWASMLNNNNQWMNNPWAYFVLLSIFGGRDGLGLGPRGGCGGGGAALADAGLAQQMQDNHNTDLIMGAIKGNGCDINAQASKAGCDANAIKSAIQALSATFGQCCCENKMETLKMGYENQLENLRQTNAIQAGFANTNGILAKGFADIGYAAQAQTCELKTNQNENTQKIIDTLNAHWGADLQQRYNDARLELSQLRQNETIIAALRPA